MKRAHLVVGAALSVFILSACTGISGFTQPAGLFPYGGLYTEITTGTQVYSGNTNATKEGKACGEYILVFATGDTSVETAMKDGGITKLSFVTHTIKAILGPVYGEVCTVARGS